MQPEKNLHASVSLALLSEVERMAAAKHVTVDELLQDAVGRIVGEFHPQPQKSQSKPFWESFTEEIHALPDEVFERFPTDGASEHDHYIYGTPKRNP